MVDWKKIALFAGGTLFGTAGIKILASDDAKKVYTNCTAAALRAKDCVMKTVTLIVKLVVSKTLTFCCNHSGCQMLLRT
ncbi:hypothetical protein FYJ75_14040 [Roseburia sp. MUC/MUC-530-WT-4D]|uniref:Uncharacterized protein n=1 Tax=Roseburia porci TaxID=2605790 RepID=A0A6L5YUM4_9FIRM|nr:hypothetical protein [Roseburia porci]